MYDGLIKMIVHDERVVCDDWRQGVKGMENCTISHKFCQSPEVFTTPPRFSRLPLKFSPLPPGFRASPSRFSSLPLEFSPLPPGFGASPSRFHPFPQVLAPGFRASSSCFMFIDKLQRWKQRVLVKEKLFSPRCSR